MTTGDRRGVLYPSRLPSFRRLPPPDRVARLVRWFWIPEWDIAPGRVSRQQLIAFPACNLAVEPGMVGLAGPTTKRSVRELTGKGWTVGALLLPAAVPHVTANPAALRDEYVALDLPDLHADVAAAMISDLGADGRHRAAVDAFSDWLARRAPAVTEEALLANAMVELVDSDPTVVRIHDAAARLGVSARKLQRLAVTYVGVSPAAMIRRRRLQEAAQRLRDDPGLDIAAIAVGLGYSDHAHLTNDFRAVLGFTPSRYRRRLE